MFVKQVFFVTLFLDGVLGEQLFARPGKLILGLCDVISTEIVYSEIERPERTPFKSAQIVEMPEYKSYIDILMYLNVAVVAADAQVYRDAIVDRNPDFWTFEVGPNIADAKALQALVQFQVSLSLLKSMSGWNVDGTVKDTDWIYDWRKSLWKDGIAKVETIDELTLQVPYFFKNCQAKNTLVNMDSISDAIVMKFVKSGNRSGIIALMEKYTKDIEKSFLKMLYRLATITLDISQAPMIRNNYSSHEILHGMYIMLNEGAPIEEMRRNRIFNRGPVLMAIHKMKENVLRGKRQGYQMAMLDDNNFLTSKHLFRMQFLIAATVKAQQAKLNEYAFDLLHWNAWQADIYLFGVLLSMKRVAYAQQVVEHDIFEFIYQETEAAFFSPASSLSPIFEIANYFWSKAPNVEWMPFWAEEVSLLGVAERAVLRISPEYLLYHLHQTYIGVKHFIGFDRKSAGLLHFQETLAMLNVQQQSSETKN